MNYLMPNELLSNGWQLYWARTGLEWRQNQELQSAFCAARKQYQELLDEYSCNGSQAAAKSNAYKLGYEEGLRRRNLLLKDGFQLETMSSNSYRGSTWMGLYGYMDAMEGREAR